MKGAGGGDDHRNFDFSSGEVFVDILENLMVKRTSKYLKLVGT